MIINQVLVAILTAFGSQVALWNAYVIVLTIWNAISQVLLKNVILHMDSCVKDTIDVIHTIGDNIWCSDSSCIGDFTFEIFETM